MQKVISFLSEVKVELVKVTWPNRESVIKLTLIVFLVSGILGLYVGGLDYLFTKLLALIVAN
jgi:preprotein translocase subunit SecE